MLTQANSKLRGFATLLFSNAASLISSAWFWGPAVALVGLLTVSPKAGSPFLAVVLTLAIHCAAFALPSLVLADLQWHRTRLLCERSRPFVSAAKLRQMAILSIVAITLYLGVSILILGEHWAMLPYVCIGSSEMFLFIGLSVLPAAVVSGGRPINISHWAHQSLMGALPVMAMFFAAESGKGWLWLSNPAPVIFSATDLLLLTAAGALFHSLE